MSEELRTEVPRETYEQLRAKFPVSADSSKASLLDSVIDYALAQKELEEMQATGRRPPRERDDK